MMLYVLLLLAGFALLIKGADLFVDGAARLARGLNVAPMAVGLTVVAFGTSAPELFVNMAAAFSGESELALGNVVGSNIANILLILGVSALIHPLCVSKGTVWKEIPFCLLATVILWVMASDTIIDGYFFSAISRSDGLVLLGYFAIFIAYTVSIAAPIDGLPHVPPVLPGRFNTMSIKMVVGFCGLLIGGRMTVDSASILAGMIKIPSAVIGLTVLALGTSLPELATSIMAARRGEVEIAVGNVVGSNIFNIFFILGGSAIIRPLPFDPKGHVDMGVMTAAGILLFIFMFTGQERIMDRWEGALAILVYCLYVGFLLFSVYWPGIPLGTAG
jgi:cation:H+ antiporter